MKNRKGYFFSIGAGKNQLPLIIAAIKQGYKIISVDQDPTAIGFRYSNVKIIESIFEYRKIIKALSSVPLTEPIAGIGCRSFGKANYTFAYLADKLKLTGPDPKSVRMFEDKKVIKSFLHTKGIRIPREIQFKNKSSLSKISLKIKYPVILKPSKGSGKKGIEFIKDRETLLKTIDQVSLDQKEWIVEEFIEGKEVTVIGFVKDQIFHLVSLIDKITTQFPPFLEISHRLPSEHSDFTGEIKMICQNIIRHSNLNFCPFVAEFKISANGDIFLIEALPEVGGEHLAENLLREYYNYDYFKNLINLLTKKSIQYKPKSPSPQSMAQILYIAPPEGESVFEEDNEIINQRFKIFLNERLKEPNSKLNTKDGNLSRTRVIGFKSNTRGDADKLDSNFRESIGAKFR